MINFNSHGPKRREARRARRMAAAAARRINCNSTGPSMNVIQKYTSALGSIEPARRRPPPQHRGAGRRGAVPRSGHQALPREVRRRRPSYPALLDAWREIVKIKAGHRTWPARREPGQGGASVTGSLAERCLPGLHGPRLRAGAWPVDSATGCRLQGMRRQRHARRAGPAQDVATWSRIWSRRSMLWRRMLLGRR